MNAEGLVYQLGHGGKACIYPKDCHEMTVIGNNTIQMVRFRYCGCDASDRANNIEQLLRNHWYPATVIDPHTCATFECLDLFRSLNVVANVNVRDFVSTLEDISDGMNGGDVPVSIFWALFLYILIMQGRYLAFGQMSRQYAFILRMKRSGVLYRKGGVASACPGAAAVKCWACPRQEVNLPNNWRDVDPNFA